jgi:phosphomannomutase/phosphoglucomutase
MSCRVVDVGLTSKPCFWFAVDHLQAAAGMFVTGSGADPSWTGFDFVGPQSIPLSKGGGQSGFDLERLEARMTGFTRRPTRQAGPYRMFRGTVPYEASLWKHFHALRPLVVCCGSASRLVQRTLERLFASLPCRLVPVELPARARDVLAPDDPDVARVSAAVRRARAHVGVLIDDDGQRTGCLDERGRVIPPAIVTMLVASLLLAEHRGAAVVLDSESLPALSDEISRCGGQVVDGGTTLADMARAMRADSAVLGGGTTGRLWFREGFPTCDAILTLARMLDVLSRSDAACSEIAASAPE